MLNFYYKIKMTMHIFMLQTKDQTSVQLINKLENFVQIYVENIAAVKHNET